MEAGSYTFPLATLTNSENFEPKKTDDGVVTNKCSMGAKKKKKFHYGRF